ncbi:MAG: APC family permease, partial [Nitrososphaerota archaeon]|nr:APC family permease [Nitrososphaerota archaeon]
FIIAIIVLLLCILPQFFRAKTTYRTLAIMFGITVIGSLVTIAAFYAAPVTSFSANFNRLSGMNYGSTISAAGLPSGFSLGVLFTGIVYTMLSYGGYNFSAYYSGEVRQVKKSQLLAMFGSLFIFAIAMFLLYASAYYSMGANFLSAISYLAGSGSPNYTLPSAPVLNFLVMFSDPNPVVIFLSSLAFVTTCAGAIITATFISVRNFFAWSFDRLMPSWLANMSSRRNSPFVAVSTALVSTIIFAALYVYTIFFQFVAYSVATVYIAFGITSIAAIVFPFRKKSIFDASPRQVTRRIGGVPLISILGVLGLIVSSFLVYASVQPAIAPPQSVAPLINRLAYVTVPLLGLIALLIYAASFYYRKSKGIELSLVFREIPPE